VRRRRHGWDDDRCRTVWARLNCTTQFGEYVGTDWDYVDVGMTFVYDSATGFSQGPGLEKA